MVIGAEEGVRLEKEELKEASLFEEDSSIVLSEEKMASEEDWLLYDTRLREEEEA